MRHFAIILFLSLIVSPVIAGTKTAPKKSISKAAKMLDLVAFVQKNGEEAEFNPPMSTNLGFPGALQTMSMRHEKEVTPDNSEHVIDTVFTLGLDGKKQFGDFILTRTAVRSNGEGKTLDGMSFRCNKKGQLTHALRATGRVGQVSQSPLDVKHPSTKSAFDDELNFFIVKMAGKSLVP